MLIELLPPGTHSWDVKERWSSTCVPRYLTILGCSRDRINRSQNIEPAVPTRPSWASRRCALGGHAVELAIILQAICLPALSNTCEPTHPCPMRFPSFHWPFRMCFAKFYGRRRLAQALCSIDRRVAFLRLRR